MTKPTITVSVSEAKDYRFCQQLHDYRYRQGLQPRLMKRSFALGGLTHECLEGLYHKTGWRGVLDKFIKDDWEPLFDEEKAHYGDLPSQTRQLLELYEYYYEEDPWEIVEVAPGVPGIEVPLDFTIETTNYFIRFRGRIDLVIRDKHGFIWVIDHKTGQSIPQEGAPKTFQNMDTQLTFYPYGLLRQYGLEAFGTMYNYLRSKAPTIPHLNKPKIDKATGEVQYEMSRSAIDTDVLTFRRFCAEHGFQPEEFPEQYEAAQANTPSFFYRMRVPRDHKGTLNVMQDMVATAINKHRYSRPVRNVTWLCAQCEMRELCEGDFFGLDNSTVLQQFKVGDPYAYLGTSQQEEVTIVH